MRTIRSRFLVAVALWLCAMPAAGQAGRIDTTGTAAAHALFDEAIALYEADEFGASFELFAEVSESYAHTDRATAALLMAGKALFAGGQYEFASEWLDRLITDHPDSRYVGSALQTKKLADDAAKRREHFKRSLFRLGVAMPLGQLRFSRPFVRGLLLAVEEHNAGHPTRPVRLVFRDSGGSGDRAAAAVNQLVSEDSVEAIIGPLYSEEAVAAAHIAQRTGILLLVPLATDESVSEGMSRVFQANPTFEMRGREMARYAVRRLRLQRFGVIVEQGTPAETEARAFISEIGRLQAEVRLDLLLPGRSAWYQLGEYLSTDTLTYVDALYAPVSGAGAQERARALLDGLSVFAPQLRVLGSGEWADLPAPAQATRHSTLYSTDFSPARESSEARRFRERFRESYGSDPDEDRLAATGYDVGHLLLSRLGSFYSADQLAAAIRSGEPYEGVTRRFHFAGGNVNTVLSFWEYQDSQMVRKD